MNDTEDLALTRRRLWQQSKWGAEFVQVDPADLRVLIAAYDDLAARVAAARAAARADAWDEGAAYATPHGGGYLRAIYVCNPYRAAVAVPEPENTDG